MAETVEMEMMERVVVVGGAWCCVLAGNGWEMETAGGVVGGGVREGGRRIFLRG